MFRLRQLCVASAEKTRQHPAPVFICVDDIGRDYRSITFVRNPLHFILCADAMADKDTRARKWGSGPISNGDAIDTLREKMMDLVDDPSKVLNEDFDEHVSEIR